MGVAVKPAGVTRTGSKGQKQTIAMMRTGSKDPKQKPSRKIRATLLDLPLPRTGRYFQDWRKKFVPLLISWAGSQVDPFGTNGQIDSAVKSVWEQVYSDIEIDDKEMDIIVAVVCFCFKIHPCSNSIYLG